MGTAPATGATPGRCRPASSGWESSWHKTCRGRPCLSCGRRNSATAAKAQQRSARRFAMVESSCALRSPVPVRGCRPMLARMTLLWLGLLTATVAAETVPACWAPGDLVHRQGEERVQRDVPQAHVTAPKRTLTEYSPVAARGAIRRVQLPPGKKLVALTFDLCEQPSEISGYQGGIVDFLRSKGIKATFFIGGKWMLSHRERTQQLMADPMFEVANHTWEHRNLRLRSGQALVDEIRNAQLAYEQVR